MTRIEMNRDKVNAAIKWYTEIIDNPHWGTVSIEWQHIETALGALRMIRPLLTDGTSIEFEEVDHDHT